MVALDADTGSVEEHQAELGRALGGVGEEARGDGEPIVLLIPRRNVETWLYYLDDQGRREADESTDYKLELRKLFGGNCPCHTESRVMVDELRSGESPARLPSLATGYLELRRLHAD